MSEPQAPSGRRRGKTKKHKAERVIDPLTSGEPADGGSDAPVELEAGLEHRLARQKVRSEGRGELREDLDVYQEDRPVEWEPDYDDESEPEPAYDDEESEFEPDYDEESDFGPDYDEESDSGPGFGPGGGPGHGPEPKLAPGPKHGPGHHPGPPHEHGPGPKKAPGKKAPGKKAPGKKAHGPKKHPGHHPPPLEHGPGHPPPPPHEHGPGRGPGGPGPEPGFGVGPGPGWGFGPGPGFGFGFGFGPGARGRRRGSGPGRRGRRGDVRAAILTLLAERSMHGYEMIQEIAERSQDLWRPSQGSVYPTLQLLYDEGLIVGSESEGSKKLFELTDEGRAAAEKVKTPPWEAITEGVDSGHANLRTALGQLFGAVSQSAYVATAEQQQSIVAILKKARREIYTLLAESE